MACDNLCGFKRNGWHDTACPESSDSKAGEFEPVESTIERLCNERDRFQEEAWTLRESLVSVREMIWNKDVPHPTTPEYREWHENCQKFMKFIDSALAAKEGE